MKHPLFACLLAMLAANIVRAGIVLDDAPQDAAPAKSIDVPKPKDGSTTPDKSAAALSDTLRFVNNDALHGSFLGYDKDAGIRWQSLESKDPIVFQTANLTEIKLDSHKVPANVAPPTHAIMLTNNDELPGVLVSLDDKALSLDTWYAGKLSIPRAMIKSITPLKTSANVLYQGPTSMDGWVIGQRGNGAKTWSYKDGALISTNYGMIGRDVKLPSLASVDFDLVCRGNSQMSVCLYSDRLDNMSNCYMFQISSGYIYLQRFTPEGSNNFGEQAQLRGEMMRKAQTHISIRVNKDTKTFWLFINGALLKQWTDPAEFAGKGGSLIFMSQPGMFTKVSNIVVSAWDGQVEGVRPAGAKSKEDFIKMENQDKVSGKLKSIENGKAMFTSSYADLTIPLERIQEITMSGEGADQAKRNASDVRATFIGRGSITMQLDSWDAKQAAASSPNFGKATFSPDAFQKLQFNLNRQPSAGDPAADVMGDSSDDQ